MKNKNYDSLQCLFFPYYDSANNNNKTFKNSQKKHLFSMLTLSFETRVQSITRIIATIGNLYNFTNTMFLP